MCRGYRVFKVYERTNSCIPNHIDHHTLCLHCKINIKVYRQSAIFLNVAVVLDISESTLMIKNNLLTNGNSAFWCQKSIVFLRAVVDLFNENHCERGNLILSMNTVTKIMQQSLVNFTHNKIQRDSYIIHSVSASVNIYGSSGIY